MYHTVTYMKTTGRITKEKYPSPEPPNEVARLVEKGFDHWRIGRAWGYYFKIRFEQMEKARQQKKKDRPIETEVDKEC